MQTEVNIPLLRKAVEWAEAEAERPFAVRQWEQRYYVLDKADENDAALMRRLGKRDCGSCYCIAGWVSQEIGDLDNNSPDGPHFAAQDALGLTDVQAELLFDAGNSIGSVRSIAERLAGERL